jgi:hypothetical protein
MMVPPAEVVVMSDERFTVSSPEAIEGLIEGWSSFTPATRALAGLSKEHAVPKRDGSGWCGSPGTTPITWAKCSSCGASWGRGRSNMVEHMLAGPEVLRVAITPPRHGPRDPRRA